MFDLTSLLATFVVWEAKRKRFDSPLGFVLVIKNANSDFAYGLCDFFAYGLRDFCVRALRLFCVRASRKFSPKPSSVNYNCLRNAWILVLQFDLHSWAHSSMQPKWRPVYWWLVYSWPFFWWPVFPTVSSAPAKRLLPICGDGRNATKCAAWNEG